MLWVLLINCRARRKGIFVLNQYYLTMSRNLNKRNKRDIDESYSILPRTTFIRNCVYNPYIHTHSECCRLSSAARRYSVVCIVWINSSYPYVGCNPFLRKIIRMVIYRSHLWQILHAHIYFQSNIYWLPKVSQTSTRHDIDTSLFPDSTQVYDWYVMTKRRWMCNWPASEKPLVRR